MDSIGYVTLQEANEYVLSHYTSTEDVRQQWEQLSDSDKSVLLLRAFNSIESLPFVGHKTDVCQTTAFPRCPHTEVPAAVKAAQIEQALSAADGTAAEDDAFYGKLWRYGVESYKIGNLSESSSSGSWGRSGGTNSVVSAGITSTIAIRLLMPYLSGGYNFE